MGLFGRFGPFQGTGLRLLKEGTLMKRDREKLGYHESIIQDDEYFIPGKQSYSRKEKLINWFHYSKWYLVAGAAGLILLVSILATTFGRTEPDYCFAYVGGHRFSAEFQIALEEALATLGQDLNGDGVVTVSITSYIQTPESDEQQDYISHMQLIADVSAQTSAFFLVEDPQAFHQRYPLIADEQGNAPEEDAEGNTLDADDWESRFLAWKDSPALTGLELPDETLWGETTVPGQELLADMYIGIRSYHNESKVAQLPQYRALWQLLKGGESSENPSS